MATYYQNSPKELLQSLASHAEKGITQQEAGKRLQENGHNRIKTTNKRSAFSMFLEQFKNMLVLLLMGAAGLAVVLGSYQDAVILMLVVLFNATVGFYQDWKSENILASLKDLIIQNCLVIREGERREVPSDELVVGDIVYLNEGDGVPADIRLLASTAFQTNDFILTGESQPAEKSHTDIVGKETAPLSDQTNCAFMGTSVAKGEAVGVVFATGMQTQIGKIAQSSDEIDASKTPLQREIDKVAEKITYVTIVLALLLFAGRWISGESLRGALLFAIGVAAAMVPEGLPAQISVSLALGVGRLARKKAVVKKMSAVEALGSATVIASDKTGTLTKNEMSIIHTHFNGKDFTITGTGYEPKGEILNIDGERVTKDNLDHEKVFFLAGFLASTGKVNAPDQYHPHWYAVGDPTECAFGTLALKAGYDLQETELAYPRLQLFPFDSFRKRVTIIREHKGKTIAFIKGSIESLLEISNKVIAHGQARDFYPEEKEQLLNEAKAFASQAKRIIAIGYKDLAKEDAVGKQEDVEQNITFAGFATMIDPPHEEVHEAIQSAYKAGLKVIMITGDNEITARAVGELVGMQVGEVINETKLKAMTDAELKTHFNQASVIFSRVSPTEKLRIVSLLKETGEIVAVTGDGVNDVLSLKKADIGVSMGRVGSKVAQEASNMVLLNDNFAVIVEAIREGRTIYNNLKKMVLANLSGNLAELLCVLIGFFGAFYGYPLVIIPIHILLIDLIANMLPLLMLSFDKPENNIMQQPPRKQGEMLDAQSLSYVLYSGFFRGAMAFLACYLAYHAHTGEARQGAISATATMASIVICQFVGILSSRTTRSIFTAYFFSNTNLFIGFGLSLAFLLFIIYLPAMNGYLTTSPLNAQDWGFVLGGAVLYLVFLEVMKKVTRK
ncbi:MAG: cation-transporting P-type ATPase [Bacteroidetes bacterium]|nr:MAG: cation-transporting P-type ATPase [Bacteroidota bacterium]